MYLAQIILIVLWQAYFRGAYSVTVYVGASLATSTTLLRFWVKLRDFPGHLYYKRCMHIRLFYKISRNNEETLIAVVWKHKCFQWAVDPKVKFGSMDTFPNVRF